MTFSGAWLVAASASIREALETITKNSHQAVMVVDEGGRLVGIVTDGDIRRGLLRDVSLDGSVRDVMNTRPATAEPGISRGEALVLMQRRRLRHLPLVDADGQLVDVLLLDDLLRPEPLPN